MTNGSPIVAVGQLPPPVTGFAHITAQMIEAISQTNNIELVNISPPDKANTLSKHTHRGRKVLQACWYLLRADHSPRVLYTGCEGDWGLVYTLIIVFFAVTRGYIVFLHHHSFSYIDQTYRLMQLIIRVGRDRIRHVFLCDKMQRRFFQRYGALQNAQIISNAAFVTPSYPNQPVAHDSGTRLGLLSNLTREKGLYTFIETVRQARQAQIDVTGILAGPIQNKSDRAFVASAEKELGSHLKYLGPLYGREKERFYHEIDVFLFPTEYANEAQPTVLFEAQAAGNLLVAFDRGCIADQIGELGIAVPTSDDFAARTLSYLRQLPIDRMQRLELRNQIRERYRTRHESALMAARSLVTLTNRQS